MSLNREEKQTLDKVIQEIENEGVTLDNYLQKDPQGLGDTVERALKKFGLDDSFVQKAMGIGGCGCQKRKKFLNRIFPYKKKDK